MRLVYASLAANFAALLWAGAVMWRRAERRRDEPDEGLRLVSQRRAL